MSGSCRVGESLNLEIDKLIWPLRYDIQIRIQFINALRDYQNLYESDFSAFLKCLELRRYFTWFKEVNVATFKPNLYSDEIAIKKHFVGRVHSIARLWRSIRTNGFDCRTPIQLMSGNQIHSVNGKTLQQIYFAGDGCHRLAILRVLGHRTLSQKQYEVRVLDELESRDNTAILLETLPIKENEYFEFISKHYCNGQSYTQVVEIVDHVAANAPERLQEVKSVLQSDLAPLKRVHDS